MAGRGRAPKDPGQRRRYNQPTRGEWVDLKPLVRPVLGRHTKGMSVPARLWAAWRSDPVTSQYGEADVAAVVELAMSWGLLTFSEQRLRMDGLGLTPKGKRDLRWRTPAEVQTINEQGAEVRKLRVVDDERERVS